MVIAAREGCAACIWHMEARDATTSQALDSVPTAKNDLAPNVNSAHIENLCFRGIIVCLLSARVISNGLDVGH